MSALKQFTFFVRNDTTREIATFIGQGTTIEDAFKDAAAAITTPWRPSSNGAKNEYTHVVQPLNVRLPSGHIVGRLKAEFEGETKAPIP